MIRRFVYTSLLVVGLSVGFTPAVQAQFTRAERYEDFLRDSDRIKSIVKPLMQPYTKSVVHVLSAGKEVCFGTVVDSDGWIITKASELRSDQLKVKFSDGRELEPKIIGIADRHDLALLKVPAKNLKPVEWRNTKTTKLGQFVLSPNPEGQVAALGVIGVLTKNMSMSDYPVANRNRNSGWLGVSLRDASDVSEDQGAVVGYLAKDGAGAKAGLELGDIIISVNGRRVTDAETLIFFLLRYRIGDEVPMLVRRGQEEVEITAKLGKRPADQTFRQMGLDRGLFQNGIHKELSDVNIGFPTVLEHDSVLRAREVGGPLVDLDGKALGINISSAGRVDSYTIPSETVEQLLPDLKSGKLAPVKHVSKRTQTSTQEGNKSNSAKPRK